MHEATDLLKRRQVALYIPFTKVSREGDSMIVEGVGTTEALDADGEIIDFDSVCKALPDYMQWANLREMHQPIAAGVVEQATPDAKAKTVMLRARVVDPGSQDKVEQGVLKGFSIGGRKGDKLGNRVTVAKITEWSLVDRPANPDCVMAIAKFDEGGQVIMHNNGEVSEMGKTIMVESVQKSLYDVRESLDMLDRIRAMRNSVKMTFDGKEPDAGKVATWDGAVAYFAGLCVKLFESEISELLPAAPEQKEAAAMQTGVEGSESNPATNAPEQKVDGAVDATAAVADKVAKRGAKFSRKTIEALAEMRACVGKLGDSLDAMLPSAPEQKDEAAKDDAAPGADAKPSKDSAGSPPEDEAGREPKGEAAKDGVHIDVGSHNAEGGGNAGADEVEGEGDEAKAAGGKPVGDAKESQPGLTVPEQKAAKADEITLAIKALLAKGCIDEAAALQRAALVQKVERDALVDRIEKVERIAIGKSRGPSTGSPSKAADSGGDREENDREAIAKAEKDGDARSLIKMIHGGAVPGTVSFSKIPTNGGK